MLMMEHLKLEKFCSTLRHSNSNTVQVENENWKLEKESLEIALLTIQDKLKQSDEREQILKRRLEELYDQNEELEFRVLELEECAERSMSTFYDKEEVMLMEKNKYLEGQVLLLTRRLSKYEALDINALENDSVGPDQSTTQLVDEFTGPHHKLSMENLRKLDSSLSDSDDDNPMVQSYSTMTSGFDEISCISFELDDKNSMPEILEDADIPTSNDEPLPKEEPLAEEESLPVCEEPLSARVSIQSDQVAENKDGSNEDNLENSECDWEIQCISEQAQNSCSSSVPLELTSAEPSLCDDTDLLSKTQASPHMERIKDIEDHVDLLEKTETRYSATIETLAKMESELQNLVGEESDENNKLMSKYSSPNTAQTSQQFRSPKAGLRLNTNLPCHDQQFDFLSPTSFNSEWTTGDQLEESNQCLHKQIRDLEKERDLLQELVYKDDNIISEMTEQMYELEQTKSSLQDIVNRLETTGQQSAKKFSHLEQYCAELQLKLKNMESAERSLKSKLELSEAHEFELKKKLEETKVTLQNNSVKYKATIADLLQEKLNLENHSEELLSLVQNLESKENTLKLKVRSLEGSEVSLQEKLNDLESSLSSAYDDVVRVTRQKDCLIQRVALLEDENQELRCENSEIKEERRKLVAETERLTEVEYSLKESNRRMWLQVNLDESNKNRRSRSDGCLSDISIVRHQSTEYEDVSRDQNVCQDKSVQASAVCSVCSPKQAVIVLEQASIGFQKAIRMLGSAYPEVLTEFVSTALKASFDNISNSAEFAETTEIMQKFITTMQFRCSNKLRPGNDQMGSAEKGYSSSDDGYSSVVDASKAINVEDRYLWQPAKGEENFWSAVENLHDAYDMRTADKWSYWTQLEDIMGVNYNGLSVSIEFRDALKEHKEKKLLPNIAPTSQSDVPKNTDKSSIPPPLPSSPPPITDSFDALSPVSCSSVPDPTDETTQTETVLVVGARDKTDDDVIAALHMQLEQKDKNLIAQMNEVDRLTQEMRLWQEKAIAATEEASKLSTSPSFMEEDKTFVVDSSNSKSLKSSARLKPYVSQIPVSVRQAVDHYRSIDLRSSQNLKSPRSPAVSPSCQGSVHTIGSSLSKPLKFPSYLPRPVEEKSQVSLAKQKEGFSAQLGTANGSQVAMNSSVEAAEVGNGASADVVAAKGAAADIESADGAAERVAADVTRTEKKPSLDEGSV